MNENEAITVTLTLENDEELDRAAAGAVHDGCPGPFFPSLKPKKENTSPFFRLTKTETMTMDKYFFIVSSTMAKTQSRIWKTSKTIRNLNVFQMHLMS